MPGQASGGEHLAGRTDVSEDVRRLVTPIMQPGTTVVITEDTLSARGVQPPVTVIEGERPR